MGNFNNPLSSNGQSERIRDISDAHASGAITQEQYEELIQAEETTSKYLQLKYLGVAMFVALIGFLLIASNL